MLPSLICDPTIVKDPERILAIISLTNLKELQRKFLSNHVESHRSHNEVMHPAWILSNLSIASEDITQFWSRIFGKPNRNTGK
jgi:hypothetical protein